MVDDTQEKIRSSFTERLIEAAAAAGWSKRGMAPRLQKELKDKGLALSVQGISKWFTAQAMPDRANLRLVAQVLSADSVWLEYGNGTAHAVRELATPYSTPDNNMITIPQYNMGGRGGFGIVLHDQPGIIAQLTVNKDWLRANLPHYTSSGALAIVTGFGDSMPQVYSPGDPVLVDTGVTACEHDGIYFFRVGEEGFIKRLQRIPGQGIRVLSQNPEYEPWTVTADMDFAVMGKVLKAWKGVSY